jgi:excisionase family DNA binding protein
MHDTPAEIRPPKLLLEAEAAQLLRCSTSTVKRLRLDRKLGYYPGRPVLIARDDIERYVASAKVLRVRMPGNPPYYALLPLTASEPRPFKLMTRAEAARLVRRTPTTIKNWCVFGKVPFLPGKPARVEEKDIGDFILSEQYRAAAKIPPAPGTPKFVVLQKQKAKSKGDRRLHKRAVRRRVERILEEIKTRARE